MDYLEIPDYDILPPDKIKTLKLKSCAKLQIKEIYQSHQKFPLKSTHAPLQPCRSPQDESNDINFNKF